MKSFTFLVSHFAISFVSIDPSTESISLLTMKLSNLRVNTSPSDTVPLLSNVLLSDATWPQVATNHSVSLEEQQQNPAETENSHRMIRRTFSFDEWDEEIAYDDKIRSTALCPVISNGEILGLLAFGNRAENYFSLHLDTLFLDFIGHVVGAALDRQLSANCD